MRLALAAALLGLLGCGRLCFLEPVLEGTCGGVVVEGVPTVLRFTTPTCDGRGQLERTPMVEVLSSDPRIFTVAELRTDAGVDHLLIAGSVGSARVIADRGPDYVALEYAVTVVAADGGARDAGSSCKAVEPLQEP